MKVIILAAGMGTRLKPLTDEVPKCMVKVNGKFIIDYQLEVMKKCSIKESDIVIVAGYKSEVLKEKFKDSNIEIVVNEHYNNTNMVYSLMCAMDIFKETDDIIISYGDIIYSEDIFRKILSTNKSSSVIVDDGWYDYWKVRADNPLDDAETLKFDENDRLIEIGQKTNDITNIMSQYIGLMRFKCDGLNELLQMVSNLKNNKSICQEAVGKEYNKIYMTDLLQYMVENEKEINVLHINRNWYEIDNRYDLNIAELFLE